MRSLCSPSSRKSPPTYQSSKHGMPMMPPQQGSLRDWWNALVELGPKFGYHVNPCKTHVLTKECHHSTASTFGDTQVMITTDGKPHLGAALGTTSFTELHVKNKVEKWSEELLHFSAIGQTHPQAAYAAFTHGLVSRWTYLTRTIENIGPLLQPFEDIIRTKFIPALCGRPAPNDKLRDLLALPCRLGGLGLLNPTRTADYEYSASKEVSTPIVNSIVTHEGSYTYEAFTDQLSAVTEIKKRKRSKLTTIAGQVKSSLPRDLQGHGPLAGEGRFQLVDGAARGGIWFLPTKRCLQGRSRITIWLAVAQYPLSVCPWVPLHSRAHFVMSKRWIPLNPT